MRSQPLLVSILIGIIVVFVIVSVSLVAYLSKANKSYKLEFSKRMLLEGWVGPFQTRVRAGRHTRFGRRRRQTSSRCGGCTGGASWRCLEHWSERPVHGAVHICQHHAERPSG